jgi:tRNA(fMet)-specific endonuclease VapC
LSLRYLVDTNIVSIAVSSIPHAQVIRRLDQHAGECAIAAPVWHELVYGCNRLAVGKRRSVIERYLMDVVRVLFPILPYDEVGATWHAQERARLVSMGRTVPFIDGQIAAVAYANSLKLVTANTRDFAAFKDIEIENWMAG